MSKHLYDENKRLRADIDRLHRMLSDRKTRESKEEMVEFAIEAVHSFLTGKAALVMTEGNDPGSKIIYFQMPPRADVPAIE